MEIPNSIKDTFVSLPISVLYDKNTTMNEKLILMEAYQLSSLEKGCVATNGHFSKKLCIPIKSVSRLVNSLKDKGYFTVNITDGSRNHERKITVNFLTPPQNEDTPKMTTTPPQNEDTPSPKCRETKEIIKFNNKTKEIKNVFNFLDKTDLEYFLGKVNEYKEVVSIAQVIAFINYRKKLKSHIKTPTPIVSFMKQLSEIKEGGHKVEDAISLMTDSEWKTIKLDWYENSIGRKVLPKKPSNLDVSGKNYSKGGKF